MRPSGSVMTSSRNSYSEIFYCYVRRHVLHHLRGWPIDEGEHPDDQVINKL